MRRSSGSRVGGFCYGPVLDDRRRILYGDECGRSRTGNCHCSKICDSRPEG